jgi:hypothetical protein
VVDDEVFKAPAVLRTFLFLREFYGFD